MSTHTVDLTDAALGGVLDLSDPTVLLRDVVKTVTGLENPAMRPGQVELLKAIHATLQDRNGESSHVGVAPTGTGKAIAGLVPAALAAVRGQRTLFSTESLSLQAQIIDKDFPVVADACQARYGVRPTIALKKGFNNYVCPAAVFSTLDEAYGEDKAKRLRGDRTSTPESVLDRYRAEVDTNPMPLFMTGLNLDLIQWALSEEGMTDGDKSRFTGEMREKEWEGCSTTSDACPSGCPLLMICPAMQAREAANHADIVVTNHTLLGIQAANAVPVVVNKGNFQHVIIDEAHALPAWVRSQGSAQVDELSLSRLAAAVHSAVPLIQSGGELGTLLSMVDDLQAALSRDLREAMPSRRPAAGETVPLPNDILLNESREPIQEWAKAVAKQLRKIVANIGSQHAAALKVQRVAGRFDTLHGALDALDGKSMEHMARWLEVVPRGRHEVIEAKCSPVDVGPLLRANVWAVSPAPLNKNSSKDLEGPDPEPETVGRDPRYADEAQAELYKVNVVAMSATLPLAFNRSIGLPGSHIEYASPFSDAYAGSFAFIPELTRADTPRVSRNGRSLDVHLHREWVQPMIQQLVAANGGRALVLAATATNGRAYAEMLRQELPGLTVYSQFDGGNLRNLIAAWRDDTHSVLVGTRSLMTGVDAPGESCSLVILDRIPRSPGNPVDDARVEALVADDLVDNKWEGDRLVYVSDARLLMEQALGRLIRAVGDRGMVAVLDPRLLKQSTVKYQEQTRKMLLKPLLKFGTRVRTIEEAMDVLDTSHAAAAA